METLKLVLLAAGEGKRMRPLTANRPKVMLPVAGKPLLEHLVLRSVDAGFRDIQIVTHYHAEAVRAHFQDGKALGARITYLDQGGAGGTGHAVARLAGKVKEPFALVYGDSLFGVKDLAGLQGRRDPAIAAQRVQDASAYGLLSIQGGRLAGLEEKPGVPVAGWVNAGAYVLTPSVAKACAALAASPRGEIELTDAIVRTAQDGGVDVLKFRSWRDVGRPWHLLEAQEELMKNLQDDIQGQVDPLVEWEGPLVVEKGARVRSGTVIEGPCIIQAGARVGPHAYLRGSTSVGRGCHVGASVEIKNSILFDGANVPHLSYVGDSILGSGVNLGAGTQVANLKHSGRNVRVQEEDGTWVDTGRRKFGVVLGDGVKTGINSTLDVGAVIGAGARVLPGRIVHGHVPAGAIVA